MTAGLTDVRGMRKREPGNSSVWVAVLAVVGLAIGTVTRRTLSRMRTRRKSNLSLGTIRGVRKKEG